MRKRLLSTPLFSVEHREFPRPGAPPLGRDVVVHPGAVVMVPILEDGRIVMIRNYRHSVEEELLELPAGTRSPGESPIETARRELEEETGYRAESMHPLTEFYTSPGICTERMHAFVATHLTHVGQRLEEGEQIRPEIVEDAAARRMIADGALRDGKTIAALGTYFARQDV